jgi:hypothetical protein
VAGAVEGRPIATVPSRSWFNEIAAFLGPAYLRNAFTKRSDRRTRSITGAPAR